MKKTLRNQTNGYNMQGKKNIYKNEFSNNVMLFILKQQHQPFFQSILPTATIQPEPFNTQSSNRYIPKPFKHYEEQHQRHDHRVNNQTYRKQNNYQNTKQNQLNHSEKKMQQVNPCLICNRTNHPTIKCFYKKENGCFKCGQSSHHIRDCPKHHFFEYGDRVMATISVECKSHQQQHIVQFSLESYATTLYKKH